MRIVPVRMYVYGSYIVWVAAMGTVGQAKPGSDEVASRKVFTRVKPTTIARSQRYGTHLSFSAPPSPHLQLAGVARLFHTAHLELMPTPVCLRPSVGRPRTAS